MKSLNRWLIIALWISISGVIFTAWYCKWSSDLEPLFSGLAFAALIATVFLQMEELQDTREQLKRSSDAPEKSERALDHQIKSMNISGLVDSYSTLLAYYQDRNYADEREQLDHVRARLKELMDNLEKETFNEVPLRPVNWKPK